MRKMKMREGPHYLAGGLQGGARRRLLSAFAAFGFGRQALLLLLASLNLSLLSHQQLHHQHAPALTQHGAAAADSVHVDCRLWQHHRVQHIQTAVGCALGLGEGGEVGAGEGEGK